MSDLGLQCLLRPACPITQRLCPNTLGYYGTITGSKFDLPGKRSYVNIGTIILAILVDLLSPIIFAKIRAQGLFGSGVEDF